MSKIKKLNAETLKRTITLEEELAWIDEVGCNSDFMDLCYKVFAIMQKLHDYPSGSFTIIGFEDWGGNRIDLDINLLREMFFSYEPLCKEFEFEAVSEMSEDWTPRADSKTIVFDDDEDDDTLVTQLFDMQECVDVESQDEEDKTT